MIISFHTTYGQACEIESKYLIALIQETKMDYEFPLQTKVTENYSVVLSNQNFYLSVDKITRDYILSCWREER